ncbi:MAG: PQQ-dependent sugar dehydrogenase [Gelidibacter sp.]
MKKIASMFAYLFCVYSFGQEIGIETFATGLNKPVNIKNAGDDRLFVAERDGTIEIVNADGSLNNTHFLDINTLVSNNGGEQGLLGLAFHPNYATNGYFYVNYIDNSGNSVISRFTRSSSDSNLADPTSELVLLNVTQPYANHNGGDLAFGTDGYLYISFGDGGSAGDPENRAQNPNTFLGKLLRIDVDNPSNGNNYGIPTTGNYFENHPGAAEEIWAIGLRNPWKFSFDSQTQDLWIADVGQNIYEEIDMVTPTSDLNFGWRCYEGNTTYDTSVPCNGDLTYPIATYTHTSSGNYKCSITGGYRYRGTAQPSLNGLYFFADFCSNEIGVLKQNGSNWDITFTQQYTGNGWTTFGEDINGEVYIAGLDSGTLYRIIDTNLSVDDYDLSQIKMYPNPAKDQFTLDFGHTSATIASVDIFNFQGQFIKTITTFDELSATISTKFMSSGVYWVEITTTNGKKRMNKLVKN